MPLPAPSTFTLAEARAHVAERCGVTLADAEDTLIRAWRHRELILHPIDRRGGFFNYAIDCRSISPIDWSASTIVERGNRRAVYVDRATLDRWLTAARSDKPPSEPRADDPPAPKRRARLARWIEQRYRDTARPAHQTVANDYKNETGIAVNERTVRRALGGK